MQASMALEIGLVNFIQPSHIYTTQKACILYLTYLCILPMTAALYY